MCLKSEKNIMTDDDGFISVEILPLLIVIEIVIVVFVSLFIIAFDCSMYYQWTKSLKTEEASIKINLIANDLDSCMATGRDCSTCNLTMTDNKNLPFLMSSYQSPNFRYYIDSHEPGSNSCVINAIKVDGEGNPVYSFRPFPQVSFDCGGRNIKLTNNMSGMDLCRDKLGKRTMYGFGDYRS